MNSNKIYDIKILLKYKTRIKLNCEKMNLFKKIVSEMPTSKINNIKKNSNKWYLKKYLNNTENIKKKINGYLNKFTEKNYKLISLKILKLKINDIDILIYLVNNLFNKIILENHYIEYWNFLLKKILFNNKKWHINNNNIIKILYNITQKYYNNLINIDYENKLNLLKDKNIKEFYIMKKRNKGFILLLIQLFKLKFINITILKDCISNLLSNIELDNSFEIGILLIINSFKYLDIQNKKYYKAILENYYNNNNQINKKNKFIILEFIEDKNNDNIVIDNVVIDNNNIITNNTNIKTTLEEFFYNKSKEDLLLDFKEYNFDSILFLYELFKYIINIDNKISILNIIYILNKNKIINKKILGKTKLMIDKNYEDLKLDYPNIKKSYDLYMNYLNKNNLI